MTSVITPAMAEAASTLTRIRRPAGMSRARWAETYLWTADDRGRLLPFRRKQSQKILRRKIGKLAKRARADHNPLHMFYVKPRRIGATREMQAEMFTMCATEPFRDGLMLGQTYPDTVRLLRPVHMYYDMLPEELKPVRRGTNKAEFDFVDLHSTLTITTANAVAGARGSGLAAVLDDEAAWGKLSADDREQLYVALQGAARNGWLMTQSTPRPLGWFKWKFAEIQSGRCEGVYMLSMTHWDDEMNRVPVTADDVEKLHSTLTTEEAHRLNEHDFGKVIVDPRLIHHDNPAIRRKAIEAWQRIAWRRQTWKKYGRLAPQEFVEDLVTCWVLMGHHFFEPDALAYHMRVAEAHPPIRTHEHGAIAIWEDYDPKCRYAVFSDPAVGYSDGDQCVSVLFNATKSRQAGEVWGRWRPHTFAKLTKKYLCDPYSSTGDALLWGIEVPGPGEAMIDAALNDLEYPNLYRRQILDKATEETTLKWGWWTGAISRPRMLEHLRDTIEDDEDENPFAFYSVRGLGECSRFKLNEGNQRYEAERGAHDEGPISFAGGLEMIRSHQFAGSTVEWI